jgi:hypothetical protein
MAAQPIAPPKDLPAFPEERVRPKSHLVGTDKLRKRWLDDNGVIYI